jgi:hypothetical protein
MFSADDKRPTPLFYFYLPLYEVRSKIWWWRGVVHLLGFFGL